MNEKKGEKKERTFFVESKEKEAKSSILLMRCEDRFPISGVSPLPFPLQGEVESQGRYKIQKRVSRQSERKRSLVCSSQVV